MPARTHGLSGTRIYKLWSGMMGRCYSKSNREYPSYGGRGIFVSKRWHNKLNFFKDMGTPPEGLSMGRIDNDSGYSKENVRWETQAQQNRNTRKTRRLYANGEYLLLADWARKLNTTESTIHNRIKLYGWTIHDAVTVPVQQNSRRKK